MENGWGWFAYSVADVFCQGVVGIELSDDGRGEDTKGVGYEVVAEPGESLEDKPVSMECFNSSLGEEKRLLLLTSSHHWFPISFQSKHVGDIVLNGMLSVLR